MGSAHVDGGPLSQAGFAVQSNELVVVEDLRREERFKGSSLLLDHNIISGVSVVLPGSTGSWGVIGCHSTESRTFDRYEIDFLQSVANVLSAVIQRQAFDHALRSATRRASERANALQVLMEAVPVAVMITTDPEADHISGNAMAYELVGADYPNTLSLEEPGAPFPDFVLVSEGQRVPVDQLPLRRAVRGETVRNYEAVLRRQDNSRRVIFGNASPLVDDQGTIAGAVGAFIDVSELNRAQQERNLALAGEREAREEVEQTLEVLREGDRRKDYFLALLGHELRNPLSSIASAARLLVEDGDEDTSRRGRIDTIIHGIERLSALLDDLLDITRITRGTLELKRRPVDLASICRRALESSGDDVDAREQSLKFELPAALWVHGDPYRLEQVIINLLSNAGKFTPAGGTITVTLERVGDRASLRVADDGIGMSQDALEEVFEPFTQIDSSASGAGGLGLGLTLVRQLVELHEGSVAATSEGPGKGTVLEVCLPVVATVEDAAPAAGTETRARATGVRNGAKSKRVLLIDDNQEAVLGLAELVARGGCAVETAFNGHEALRKVESFDPEVLILDIGLPDISGYDVVRKLAETELLGDRTIIALSGFGHQEAHRRSREAGIHHHLVKPVDLDRLRMLLAGV